MKQILLVLAVFSALLSCAVEEVVFQADFNRKDAVSKWSKNPDMTWQSDGGINNSGCLKFHSTDPNGNHLTYIPLDINKLRGRGVVVEGWMKADQVQESSRSYLGPKLMLSVTHDGTTSYPDQTKKYGTYNWEKFSRYWQVPATATKAYLNLGLQGTTGTVWIDEVRVFLTPALKVPARLEKQLPRQKRTQYRGVMSGNDLSEEAIRELKEVWNANLIRFQIGLNNGLDHTTEAGFRKIVENKLVELEKLIPLARKYGIKILIDMHVGPGTSTDVLLRNQLSWEPKDQQLLVDIWREIAAKYGKEPVIWGYDLLNEPRDENYVYKTDGGLDWNRLAARIAAAIREVDPETPIIVESTDWGGPEGFRTLVPINQPNMIYSFHFYYPNTFTHQGVVGKPDGVLYPGHIAGEEWNREKLKQIMQPVIDFQNKYNVPIYVGEFGVARWAPNAEKWLEDVISIFEENGWDWTYHAYREYNGWDAEIGSDKNDRTRIGDTPRRRVLLKYMRQNEK